MIAKETPHSKRVSCEHLKRLQTTQHGQKKLNFLLSTCQALVVVPACRIQLVGRASTSDATPLSPSQMSWNPFPPAPMLTYKVKRSPVPPNPLVCPYDWGAVIHVQFTQELLQLPHLFLIPRSLPQRCVGTHKLFSRGARFPIHRTYVTSPFTME